MLDGASGTASLSSRTFGARPSSNRLRFSFVLLALFASSTSHNGRFLGGNRFGENNDGCCCERSSFQLCGRLRSILKIRAGERKARRLGTTVGLQRESAGARQSATEQVRRVKRASPSTKLGVLGPKLYNVTTYAGIGYAGSEDGRSSSAVFIAIFRTSSNEPVILKKSEKDYAVEYDSDERCVLLEGPSLHLFGSRDLSASGQTEHCMSPTRSKIGSALSIREGSAQVHL